MQSRYPLSPRQMALTYRHSFGFQLRNRLAILAHRYPDIVAPNFLSWEGETLTNADTSEKVRALLKLTPYV